jgi:CRP-like cAMP-binding protein
MDGHISLTDAIVLLPGTASVLDLDRLRTVSRQRPDFQTLPIRHEQALFRVSAANRSLQCGTCGRSAPSAVSVANARLSEVTPVPLTQDATARMIGVRRNSASISAHALQQAGIIKYSRGKIQITDLDGLKRLTCECYD